LTFPKKTKKLTILKRRRNFQISPSIPLKPLLTTPVMKLKLFPKKNLPISSIKWRRSRRANRSKNKYLRDKTSSMKDHQSSLYHLPTKSPPASSIESDPKTQPTEISFSSYVSQFCENI
jgi:hypothetical protein